MWASSGGSAWLSLIEVDLFDGCRKFGRLRSRRGLTPMRQVLSKLLLTSSNCIFLTEYPGINASIDSRETFTRFRNLPFNSCNSALPSISLTRDCLTPRIPLPFMVKPTQIPGNQHVHSPTSERSDIHERANIIKNRLVSQSQFSDLDAPTDRLCQKPAVWVLKALK